MGAQWGESIARGQLPRAWREGATWSYSEPKVGNFRIFAPPIHVAALWPVAFGFRGDSNNRTECAVVLIPFVSFIFEEFQRLPKSSMAPCDSFRIVHKCQKIEYKGR